jgi:hypothetical protein
MKDNNLVFVRGENGGTSPAILFEKPVYEKVEKFLAKDVFEFYRDTSRCVLPEYDSVQSVPIIKQRLEFGYATPWAVMISVFTGWHLIRKYFKPSLYRANSEGLRLIAELGSPEKAYASL